VASALVVNFPWASKSPIAHLLPSIGPAIERIAPERVAELERITCGVQLQITDTPRWICQASPGWKLIQLSTRVIEVAWAFAYAYFVLYKCVFEGTQPTKDVVDLSARMDVQPALRLLEWALDELIVGPGHNWPADVPSPSDPPLFASREHVADEIALCAVGFFLHHELAHTYLTLSVGATAIEHERACDAAAAEWILGADGITDLEMQKRGLGVAVALLLITAKGVHSGQHDDVTHPIDFERLVDILLAKVPREQRAVWGMVAGVLSLHMTRRDILPPDGHFDDFVDAVLSQREVLRAHLLDSSTNTTKP